MSWAWDSWTQFWAMGGYGPYVWSALGLSALLMAAECWQLTRPLRRSSTEPAPRWTDET